ncbi:MAG: hypothetical protein C3F17_06860 [Bradyrhizobiaceae bacterium]|nr:MAG: hypothetical protein C3F17_06860 [Bradyrhizobiaceae bacterium]
MRWISSKGLWADRPLTRVATVTLIAGYAAVLNLWGLGQRSLQGDEAIYALLALNAVTDGTWYPLALASGNPYVNKPPLIAVPLALSFELFGVNEFSARLPSALGGIGLVLTTFWLGERVAGFIYGALAALFLASAPSLLTSHGVRDGVADGQLSLCALLGLAFYAKSRLDGSRLYLFGSSFALAIGVLFKGPFLPLAFLASVVIWELTNRAALTPHRDKPNMELMRTLGPAVLVFLLAMSGYVAWLAHSYLLFPAFPENLYMENVARHVQGLTPSQLGNAWVYPKVLYQNFGVWLLALPMAVYAALASRSAEPAILIARLLWCWTAAVLIAVSLSVSKLAHYAYPAFASLSILIALGVRQTIAAARELAPPRGAKIALTLLLAVPAAATFGAGVDAVRKPPQIIELHALKMLARENKEIGVTSLLPDPLSPRESGHRKSWNNAFYLKTLGATPGTEIATTSDCRVLISDEERFQSAEVSHDRSVMIVEGSAEWERNIGLVDSCGGRALAAIWRASESFLRGSAMSDGIDFSRPGFASDVVRISGLGVHEPWGRWSVANRVVFEFDRSLPARFELSLRVTTFGPNQGRDVKVRVGRAERSFPGDRGIGSHVLQFENAEEARSIQFEIPSPTSPRELGLSADFRRLGVGFLKMGIVPAE